MKSSIIIIFIFMLASCAGFQQNCAFQNQLGILRSGSFQQAEQAGRMILKDERLAYGKSSGQIFALLGSPDHKCSDRNNLEVYYKTQAGPLRFCFRDDKLVKKALIHPGRWRGTKEELVRLWKEKSQTETWYQW
jgi:hypothetical protein